MSENACCTSETECESSLDNDTAEVTHTKHHSLPHLVGWGGVEWRREVGSGKELFKLILGKFSNLHKFILLTSNIRL